MKLHIWSQDLAAQKSPAPYMPWLAVVFRGARWARSDVDYHKISERPLLNGKGGVS